jgi:hypothetical protein
MITKERNKNTTVLTLNLKVKKIILSKNNKKLKVTLDSIKKDRIKMQPNKVNSYRPNYHNYRLIKIKNNKKFQGKS